MSKKFRGGYATCVTCNKILYETRKDAKRLVRIKFPGAKGLNAYFCEYGQGWHIGNLPPGGRDQARRIMKRKFDDQ